MKKTVAVLLSLLIPVIFVSSVAAQDIPTSGRPPLPRPLIKQRPGLSGENVADKIAAMRENIASREAALKTKLQAFKDQRKAQIADRINTNLNKINQVITNQMLKFLDKATDILNKLEARVNQGTPDIKDPVATRAAIADARTKIASAQAAVKAQQANDYTITVTSENSVKKDAQATREKLHSDLLAVRKQVIEAKQAVANAISIAKTGTAEKMATESAKEATTSGQ